MLYSPPVRKPNRSIVRSIAVGVLAVGLVSQGPDLPADPSNDAGEKLSASEPEFQVNTYTNDSQSQPVVAEFDDGFVVAWFSPGSLFDDTDSFSIQGRLLDVNGQPVASEFQVNSYTTGSQRNPWIAAWNDGRFVATWRSESEIRARVFDSSGAPIANDFVVATDTTYINEPVVEVMDDSFLVVWTQTDADLQGVSSRLYSSDGTPLGAIMQVNSFTTGFQANARVRRNASQEFVVVWGSDGSFGDDTDSDSIQLRRVGSDGVPIDTDFQVNSYTTGYQISPQIGFADDGGFVVAWSSQNSPGGDNDAGAVVARRFDSAGDPLGTDFQVNTFTADYQYPSDVRGTLSGDFVIVWSGHALGSADSDEYAVLTHRYDSGGASVGGDVVVNTLTTGFQAAPTLAQNGRGDFLIVWDSDTSNGSDSSSDSIQARFFAAEADMAVTVGNGVDTVTPGGSVIYTVEVSNSGPDTATGVELTDVLTSELTCDWTSIASGGASGNTASGSGDLAETLRLPPGAAVTYTLACDVAFDATGGLVHSADLVAVDQVDDIASNDSAFDFDVLERSTDLSLELATLTSVVVAGDEVELTATVTQAGPSASSGAMVFSALPAELTFAGSDECVFELGFVQCEIPPLDPGTMATVTYRVAVNPSLPPEETIDTVAVVFADDTDPGAGNDADSVTLTVGDLVFRDGFESGDTSVWSTQVP